MPVPIKDAPHPDNARSGVRERHALYESDQALHNTNAVFNVLDALEPAAGRQRILRGGLILLAATFLVIAVALLVSRYREGTRLQPVEIMQQGMAKDVEEKSAEDLAAGEGRETSLNAPAALAADGAGPASGDPDSPGFFASDRALAANTAQLPIPGEKPAAVAAYAAGSENVGRNAVEAQREPVRQPVRKSERTSRKPQDASPMRDRIVRSSQTGQGTKRIIQKRNAAAPDKARRKDADVDLIAALLSRAPHKPVQANGRDKPSDGGTAANAPAREASARPDAPAANSDVVIRTQADTTESLVKRCGTLGLIEGHLCRTRICSGLWGKDAACPISNSANLHY